ncbi:MAG TPA: phospholipase D-like domain-containing protein [Spirochaetota bacterium]|nr:phospholipase D-like domain-containing protein [Spirochaetota bacterium]
MRFKSKTVEGYTVYAVSGIHSVSFAIDFEKADTINLLGFAIERESPAEKERYFMKGFKVFEEIIPNPDENTIVSTFEHPIQSFVWDDFTTKPGFSYNYYFYPLKGKPKNIDRSSKPILLPVKTESLSPNNKHNIYFNRGVASSQAYRRKFNNESPESIKEKDKKKYNDVLTWLARGLDNAIIQFISQAKRGDTLLACFYEFRYKPILDCFKEAIDRGVKVKIIIDAKQNEYIDKKTQEKHESFPRVENLQTIKEAGIPKDNIIMREANKSSIQHNKFIVFIKNDKPVSLWTGSTNISLGGIHGQTNVGHWVNDTNVAEKYQRYWELLYNDPGGQEKEEGSKKIKDNKLYKQQVEEIQENITIDQLLNNEDVEKQGITPIFSPRINAAMLETYVGLVDKANSSACITLAFGINKIFKEALQDNTPSNHITFILLDKKDVQNPKSKETFISIGAKNNVYKAWGAYIKDPLYQWAKEVNTEIMKLNTHVKYIHTKFLLKDPLSADPIVVTGSANFSEDSTNSNDENMIIIRGETHVADIYFTEFNRLFNHYYFRCMYEELKDKNIQESEKTIFLDITGKWLQKYKAGKFRYKRVKMFSNMQNISK